MTIPKDKIKHFTVCFVLTLLFCVLGCSQGFCEPIYYALSVFLVGITREYDKWDYLGVLEIKDTAGDLLFDAIGITAGILLSGILGGML
jgi:hypothetical protein